MLMKQLTGGTVGGGISPKSLTHADISSATASSTQSTYTVANTYDGLWQTWWCPATGAAGTEYVVYDLGSAKNVRTISLGLATAASANSTVVVSVWQGDSSSSFDAQPLVTTPQLTANNPWNTQDHNKMIGLILEGSKRYYKIAIQTISQGTANYNVGIGEIEFFAE